MMAMIGDWIPQPGDRFRLYDEDGYLEDIGLTCLWSNQEVVYSVDPEGCYHHASVERFNFTPEPPFVIGDRATYRGLRDRTVTVVGAFDDWLWICPDGGYPPMTVSSEHVERA